MKHLKTTHRYIVLLLAIMALQSCGSNNEGIYHRGREWTFRVGFYNKDSVLTDSCTLQMQVKAASLLSIITGQNNLSYTSDNCCGKPYKETTGVQENEESISLHNPHTGCFSFIDVLPLSSVTLPPDIGSYTTIVTEVYQSPFKKALKKTLKKETKVTGIDTFLFNGQQLKCYVTEGRNTNYLDSLGQYKSTYLFNEHYGFVAFYYQKPDSTMIRMTLIKTNFQ